jgi:hypothetical protein
MESSWALPQQPPLATLGHHIYGGLVTPLLCGCSLRINFCIDAEPRTLNLTMAVTLLFHHLRRCDAGSDAARHSDYGSPTAGYFAFSVIREINRMSPSSTLCASDTSRIMDHREYNPIFTSASAARTSSTSYRPRKRLRQAEIERDDLRYAVIGDRPNASEIRRFAEKKYGVVERLKRESNSAAAGLSATDPKLARHWFTARHGVKFNYPAQT